MIRQTSLFDYKLIIIQFLKNTTFILTQKIS